MPKEVIGRPLIREGVMDGNCTICGQPWPCDSKFHPPTVEIVDTGVEVGWSREGTVYIATVDFSKDPFTEGRGWFVNLSRDQLNALVRVARRARDQAYGADE